MNFWSWINGKIQLYVCRCSFSASGIKCVKSFISLIYGSGTLFFFSKELSFCLGFFYYIAHVVFNFVGNFLHCMCLLFYLSLFFCVSSPIQMCHWIVLWFASMHSKQSAFFYYKLFSFQIIVCTCTFEMNVKNAMKMSLHVTYRLTFVELILCTEWIVFFFFFFFLNSSLSLSLSPFIEHIHFWDSDFCFCFLLFAIWVFRPFFVALLTTAFFFICYIQHFFASFFVWFDDFLLLLLFSFLLFVRFFCILNESGVWAIFTPFFFKVIAFFFSWHFIVWTWSFGVVLHDT